MKTNQIMTRRLAGFEIQQRTQDGFFDGNALLMKWNDQPMTESKRRRMDKFLDARSTKEFIKALAMDESHREKNTIVENQLVSKVAGRYYEGGRTPDRVWMHPLLFIKFAMWLNPTFEVQVLRFVADKMLEYRNEAGEAYKAMAAAVAKLSGKKDVQTNISKVAEAVNFIVFGKHDKLIRNQHGDETKMRELFELERTIAFVVSEGFINDYSSLMVYLRNQWRKRHVPQVFTREQPQD